MKYRKSLYIVIGCFFGIVLLVNLVFKEPDFDNLMDQAVFEQEAGQPERAEQTLWRLIVKEFSNLDAHYEYICTHFDVPTESKDEDGNITYRNDQVISQYYDNLSGDEKHAVSDIGHYGSGLIAVFQNDYAAAMDHFRKVRNQSLKYLNNSIGNVYMRSDSVQEAIYYFNKEIDNRGNLKGAYSNLIYLYYYRVQIDQLEQLLEDEEAKTFFPPGIERVLHFNAARPVRYFLTLVNNITSRFNTWGILAAFLIMVCWVIYLRKLDIFEVEKWIHIIITVALGAAFSLLVYPISDFNNIVLGFDLNGRPINDFLYCVIGIGAVEEIVKIIPLLIMLRFSGVVNEPFDYIKYASLSALGFAFFENLIYFDESSLHIIHGRALTAVVSHMFDSSVFAYGLMLNKYKRRINPFLNFMYFFMLASLAHGFYDFWLISPSVSDYSFITIIFLLVSLLIWNSLKNNALNQSGFFSIDKKVDHSRIEDWLLYSLCGVLLFEFIALANKYGPDVATDGLLNSLYSGTFLIIFISSSLGRIDLHKGEWISYKEWFWRKKKI
jgi:protease PrsW